MILIDSRSTHNFLSEQLTASMSLLVMPTKPFSIRVADGRSMKCQKLFEQVPIKVQCITFNLNFYALPLIGLDAVLGVH